MRFLLLVGLVATLAVVPQACSNGSSGNPQTSTSHTDSIATDLPDDGGSLTHSLYYTNNGRIYRGRCIDPDQFNRSNCSSELVSMPYDAFKTELDGGLSDTIRELTAESKRIQDAIALIEKDLADARAELDRLAREEGPLDAQLTTLRANIQKYEQSLSEYKEQLALIDAALAQAADQEVAAMRPIVMARISDWQNRIAQVNVQIETIMQQFGQIHTQIETIAAKVAQLSTRSQNLHTELAGVNERLELAYGDFAFYTETLRRLNDGITYTVWSTNTLLLRQRLFIKRFESIFQRHT
jgi:predicted nuclease with TOPRIM domain